MSLGNHPYFEPWRDPESGTTSYILTRRVAPLQKNFYFTHSSISADERVCWFYAGFPPNRQMTLAAVGLDPENPWIRHFPATGFDSVNTLLSPDSRGAFFTTSGEVWFQALPGNPSDSSEPTPQPTLVGRIPEKLIDGRVLIRTATHLTISADGQNLLLDSRAGHEWFVGVLTVETGEYRHFRTFAREYNHAQFSPIDPELFLISQDHFRDPVSGRWYDYEHRIWLASTCGNRFEPLCPDELNRKNALPCHEWWLADGRVAWVDYDRGVFAMDIRTRKREHIWNQPLCHAHADPTGRWWCADQNPYDWPEKLCQVMAMDRKTDRRITIASALPAPPVPRGWYHIDPHPQFSPRGSLIIYTTTARGMVDLALVPISELSS